MRHIKCNSYVGIELSTALVVATHVGITTDIDKRFPVKVIDIYKKFVRKINEDKISFVCSQCGCIEKEEVYVECDYCSSHSLIEKVLELGASIWATNEGYKTSTLLFNFIQEHGEKLNANHVATLIIRGKECSRTGINALGILYDTFPRHVLSLKLRERFKNFNDPRLYYYCTIRERYLGLKSPAWLSEENDLTVDNLRADFSAININIIDKWANRGDSVIFDYIYKITK